MRNQWRKTVFADAVHGLAAWSAYAVLEFMFSSVLFRYTRPYAEFSSWHWDLTLLLTLGYASVGVLLGVVAGAAARIMSKRVEVEAGSFIDATVLAAFGVHLVLTRIAPEGLPWLLAVSLALLGTLLIPGWRLRAGWLTNPWVFSGILLALAQKMALRGMGVAMQLGAPLGRASIALDAALVFAVAVAVLAGRRWRLPESPLRTAALGAMAALIVASLAGSAQSGAAAAASQTATSARPDIYLIVMDTVRADHLSVYGYARDTTPNLRELARDSAVFTNAVSATDITLTSHASLFTGLYPSWHGAYCDPPNAPYGRSLSEKVPTVAELLRQGGYRTVGVAANLYLRADFGLERGFDRFVIPRPVPLLAAENNSMLREGMRRLLNLVADTAQFDRLYTRAEDITEGIRAETTAQAQPTFVFANYMDAHFPYVPTAPFAARFPGRHRTLVQEDLELDEDRIATGRAPSAVYRGHAISQYDGGIAYIDAQIGALISRLRREGRYERSMIVVTSDHGEAFGERSHVGHANSPYQNLLHTVLLVKYPESAHRGRVDLPVSLTGVAPTILAAAGVPVPATMQGVQLAEAATRTVYAETFPCQVRHSPDCPNGCSARAVFEWPYKFIASSNGRRELFQIASDPQETRNLYIREPEMAAALQARLNEWTATMPQATQQIRKLSPEDLQRLKSLGYVQ